MSEENEQQDVVEETLPVEETIEESPTYEGTPEEETQTEDDSVSLSKHEFNKLKRKAIAYDSGKQTARQVPAEASSSGLSYEALFAVKDISKDEFESLQNEAEDLGISVEKYLKTQSSKVFLSNLQNKKKSQDASVSLNSKSPVYKKFTQEDLSKMSSKELEKILPQ